MASQGWCADRLGDWVKKNPKKGAKDAKEKLESDFGIKLKYSKAWSGLKVAMEKIHGKYEESFQLLFNWSAHLKEVSPGSHVEIEVEKVGKKKRFKRMFVALKPCIDGFLAGCRPFVGVDASFLHGKYTGQLVSATGVDGHNWLYHIAYGIFESETEDNWTWFLENLHKAIGDPPGLVLCSDACKGLEVAITNVFPNAENRECMRHLYSNFMKHYSGDVFTDHLYPAAKNYTEYMFKWHMQKIFDFAPSTIEWLEENHPRIWYRCGFSELSKCDYLTNNVSESFNAQIKHLKGLHLHELVDRIRELIMEKRYIRRKLAQQWPDGVLPQVIKELNVVSNNLKVVKISISDEDFAEVTLLDDWNNHRRHTVDLKNNSCSCRQWQVTGKPCKHALAWILSNRGLKIDDYVHEYYSVARFRAAYEGRVQPMQDRSHWPEVDLGFKIFPPLLGRAPGRPKVKRIRGCIEKNSTKKKVRCSRCKGFGHFAKTCKLGMVGEDGETSKKPSKKRLAQPKLLSCILIVLVLYSHASKLSYAGRNQQRMIKGHPRGREQKRPRQGHPRGRKRGKPQRRRQHP
jgi:hypothetical protein